MAKKYSDKQHDPFLAREAENYETPIPSREFILMVLEKWGGPVKRNALTKHFELTDLDLIEGLRRRLRAMVRDGQLLKTPQGYVPLANAKVCKGLLIIEREGEGYLRSEDGQIIGLSGPMLRGYYHHDEIEVQVIEIDREGNARGRILSLLKATVPQVIGRFLKTRVRLEVIPFDRKYSQNIIVPKEMKNGAKDGDIVQVEILRDEKYAHHVEPVAKIVEVLGDFSTPGIEVNIALRKFNIPYEWPPALLQECAKLPKEVKNKDGRKDLTALGLVTIDGEDAKDFDDAVYCEAQPAGGWRLWVAIADVSYYVKPGSALDKEASVRGNSTYFPNSVVPMLPEVLSNELCSLKPNVPRLSMVCQMSIDKHGTLKRSIFYHALMQSKARLTYTEVAEMLRGHTGLREKYAAVLPNVEALHDLYEVLHKQRKKRGAIDFDTVETQILFDAEGKIKTIVPRSRNIAHKMIEESMLAANVCAAKFLLRHKRPTLYRVHDRPPKEKLSSLREFLAELGLDLPGRDAPSSKDFSALMAKVQKREDKHIIETVMLRSLSQAQYSPKNIGHFGLAYPYYAHFTSPIRRYPDLLVHREIVDILYSKNNKKPGSKPDLEKLGMQCSEAERRSDDATRDAQLALKCHYMLDKVGSHFSGIVCGVASFGIFVELKDIYVEGMVHVTALGNEYFHYDQANHRMVGDRTRTVYRLGDKLEVKVVRVDIEAKKIDLELLQPSANTQQDSKKFTRASKQTKNQERRKKKWRKRK